jgi:hypothetical protein
LPTNAPNDEKDLIVLMIASTWPDQIKRDPTYTADGSHNGNRPDGSPDPARNTGYDDKLMHKYWHFIDTPFSRDRTALPSIPTPNAETQIAAFRRVPGRERLDRRKFSRCPAIRLRGSDRSGRWAL